MSSRHSSRSLGHCMRFVLAHLLGDAGLRAGGVVGEGEDRVRDVVVLQPADLRATKRWRLRRGITEADDSMRPCAYTDHRRFSPCCGDREWVKIMNTALGSTRTARHRSSRAHRTRHSERSLRILFPASSPSASAVLQSSPESFALPARPAR